MLACIVMRLLQVAESYVPLVTSINNADTLITLIVPSVMIIFSNVRISVALSQFSRDRQLMLAQNRRDDSSSGDAAAAAVAAAATAETRASCTSQSRGLRCQTSLTLGRAASTDCTQLTAIGNGSFNQLQMKVGTPKCCPEITVHKTYHRVTSC